MTGARREHATVAFCRDGAVEADVEACDDGNADDTDASLASCVAATCGDGVAHAGTEACDDGNAADDDGCSAACEEELSGGGDVSGGSGCASKRGGGTGSALMVATVLCLALRLRRRR